MASLWKRILEEEVEQLRCLQSVMQEERESLARMDREDLLRLTGEKEALAKRMRRLNARKEELGDADEDSLARMAGMSVLLQARTSLLRELREMNRVQKEIIDTQKGQVGQLLSFLQNLRHPSTTYDSKGNFR